MSPKSQSAITVAAIAVGAAAVLGIAAIEGWLPDSGGPGSPPTQPPRVAGTAPPESLSPGESIVTVPDALRAPPPSPAVAPPAPADAPQPAAKPAPRTPSYARAPSAAPEQRRPAGKPCGNCGVVSSTTYRQSDVLRGGAWEVRVQFDDGTRAALRFPTAPGFRGGQRVVFRNGRLLRD